MKGGLPGPLEDGEEDLIDCLYWICYHLVWDGGGGAWCWWPRLLGYSIWWDCLIFLLLDIYLLVNCLGYRRWNGSLIGISWWRPTWCCFPRSLGYPLVWEIWSSITRVLFYLFWSGDWSSDCGINSEIWSSLVISIGRSWERLGVWSGDRDRYRFGSVGLILVRLMDTI